MPTPQDYESYAHLTNKELLAVTRAKPEPTDLELELAERLEAADGTIEGLAESAAKVMS